MRVMDVTGKVWSIFSHALVSKGNGSEVVDFLEVGAGVGDGLMRSLLKYNN
jgi:hypothetical protein